MAPGRRAGAGAVRHQAPGNYLPRCGSTADHGGTTPFMRA